MFSIGLAVSRSITINKPVSEVYARVADFSHWPTWSPWIIQEPTCPVSFSGEANTLGHKQEWNGERIGKGDTVLVEKSENEFLQYDLTFYAPWKSESKTRFEFKSVKNAAGDEATQVTWNMDGSLPFFMFFIKKMMLAMIGSDYDRGLNMLKELVETGDVSSKVSVDGINQQDGFHYVGFRHCCNIKDIKKVMGPSFQNLIDEKLPAPDMMITLSHKFDMTTGEFDLTAAFAYKTKPDFDVPTNMVFGEIAPHQGLEVQHTGSYNHLANGWATAKGYQMFAKLKASKTVPDYEIYRNAPGEVAEKDLLTSIVLPLKD
jgi:predicted transcriptional regulator YdeE/uncharacterized membrane protein